jgi:hypothetical protein
MRRTQYFVICRISGLTGKSLLPFCKKNIKPKKSKKKKKIILPMQHHFVKKLKIFKPKKSKLS